MTADGSAARTFERVAVVGAGLIGGSIARRLGERGLDVVAVDPDAGTRADAAAAGLEVGEQVPADRDLVILANPLDVMPAVLAQVASAAPDAVVIDVGSAKVVVRDAAAAAGLEHRYVGCHPMAGTEWSGFAHSDPELLVGATWAVTSSRLADVDPLVVGVVGFLVEHFAATVTLLDAGEHDRAVALVSHAPHVLAHALLGVAEAATDLPAAVHLAAGSFRDGTRVAGRSPLRTYNMLVENTAALGAVVDDLIVALEGYRRDLDDPAALRARLDDAALRADAVRRPVVVWSPCGEPGGLGGLVRDARESGSSYLVRRGEHGLEQARP